MELIKLSALFERTGLPFEPNDIVTVEVDGRVNVVRTFCVDREKPIKTGDGVSKLRVEEQNRELVLPKGMVIVQHDLGLPGWPWMGPWMVKVVVR